MHTPPVSIKTYQHPSTQRPSPINFPDFLHEQDVRIGIQGGKSIRIPLPHLFKCRLRRIKVPWQPSCSTGRLLWSLQKTWGSSSVFPPIPFLRPLKMECKPANQLLGRMPQAWVQTHPQKTSPPHVVEAGRQLWSDIWRLRKGAAQHGVHVLCAFIA